MPKPMGKLVTPVGFNSDGKPRGLPLLWGYSDMYRLIHNEEYDSTGAFHIYTNPVPTGRIRYISSIFMYFYDGDVRQFAVNIQGGSSTGYIWMQLNPAEYTTYWVPFNGVLVSGEYLDLFVEVTSSPSTIKQCVIGYDMEV